MASVLVFSLLLKYLSNLGILLLPILPIQNRWYLHSPKYAIPQRKSLGVVHSVIPVMQRVIGRRSDIDSQIVRQGWEHRKRVSFEVHADVSRDLHERLIRRQQMVLEQTEG